ncbi:hypothetical protein Tco_0793370 [Tanacetum coccineum]
MIEIQAAEGEGSGHPSEPQPLSSTAQPTLEELIPNVVSSSHQKTQTPRQALNQSYDSPLPRVHTLGSDEGNMTLLELTVLCTTLSKKVESLEADLKQTKKFETEVYTANDVSTTGAVVTTAGASISTANPPRVSTVEYISTTETLVYIRRNAAKDKGKAKMDESEPEQTKTKLQQGQERAGSHTLQQLNRLSFDELKNLFEATIRRVGAFVPMETEIRREVLELAARSSKRDAEKKLDQRSSKRQKTSENSKLAKESKEKEDDELSQEEPQQLMIIVPEEGMNVEALQTKYPIIDWEVYTEDSRIDDLVKLWSLVQERFNSTDPTKDKEIDLWVELKRLFKPDVDDELWKSQKHVHDITWRLYDTCGVHHVSTKDGIDIYMLVEKEYPLSRCVLT